MLRFHIVHSFCGTRAASSFASAVTRCAARSDINALLEHRNRPPTHFPYHDAIRLAPATVDMQVRAVGGAS
jgi:hypothetical protein